MKLTKQFLTIFLIAMIATNLFVVISAKKGPKNEAAVTHCLDDPSQCDDGNPYTADICDPDGRCLHQPIRTCTMADRWMKVSQCDDGNPCTNDRCWYGHCSYETIEDCNAEDEVDLGTCSVDGCKSDNQCPMGSYCKDWQDHGPFVCQGCEHDDPCCERRAPREQGDGYHENHCMSDDECEADQVCDMGYCIDTEL